jgi:sulfatase maturation enzyme AslB (radical SAM superfamily)
MKSLLLEMVSNFIGRRFRYAFRKSLRFFGILYLLKLINAKLLRTDSPKRYASRVMHILKKPDLVPAWKMKMAPVNSLIGITNACNLNCRMCNTKMSNKPVGFISTKVFSRIIKQLKKVGIHGGGIYTIGEVFRHENLHDLSGIMKEEGFIPSITTNGMFPDRLYEL